MKALLATLLVAVTPALALAQAPAAKPAAKSAKSAKNRNGSAFLCDLGGFARDDVSERVASPV